ncbi:hypothetical protein BV509_08190 [Rhodovulum sulfidophilum]|nr:hypothetical protein BV509_08190 [Rhodovulum sulfidophilum]
MAPRRSALFMARSLLREVRDGGRRCRSLFTSRRRRHPVSGRRSGRRSRRAATGQHAFDLLCTDLGIEHRLAPPMRPQTNGMAERFNGRIGGVLQSHRFHSGEDLEQTLLRCVHLCNSQLPQSALKARTPVDALKDWQGQRPERFRKRVCNHAGCDSWAAGRRSLRPGRPR